MSQNNVWMGLSHSGGTSQLAYSTSVGTERSKTASDGVSVNLSVSVGSSFMGFGASVGVSSSLSSLRSKGVSTAQVTTTQTGGSVQNLDADRKNYGFDWQLIGWKTEASDGLFKDVPFVGYAVKNVSAPMAYVSDLKCTYTSNPSEVVLSWTAPPNQEGRIPTTFFQIFRTDGGKRELIRGTNQTSFTYKCTDLTASFVVVAQDWEGKNRSADSNEVTAIFALTEPQVRALIEQTSGSIDAAIAALKASLETGQAEAIAKAIADLTSAYQAADEVLKAEIGKDMKALEDKLAAADAALQAAIDQVQANLDKAVENLPKLIEDNEAANAEALQKAVADLTAAYQAADALLKADIDGLSANLTALAEKLTKADGALQNAIDAVQANLNKAIEDLTDGMLDEEISVPDYTETELITDAFNKMVNRMKILDESRQEFVSNVSHELKTPLTSMKVLADSLVGQQGVPEELYQEFMSDITAEIDRENKIITDLLSLVKMDKKAADVNITHMDINQLLEDILKRLRPIADKFSSWETSE